MSARPPLSALSIFSRRRKRRAGRSSTLGAPTSASMRLAVAPPALRCAPEGLWQRVAFWLLAPAPHDVAPPVSRLHPVRAQFVATLTDIEGEDAAQLRERIEQATTLRELWHLRTEVYRVVGVAFSQGRAEERLALLNQHFPARSQFAAP